MKDTDRWEERGSPWNMLESVVCRGVAGAMLRAPRGVEEEDLQHVMDPQTGRGAAWRQMHAEERCMLSERICRTLGCHTGSRSQSREEAVRRETTCAAGHQRNCFHHSLSINMLARGLWSKPNRVQCIQRESTIHTLNNCQQTPASGFSMQLTWKRPPS